MITHLSIKNYALIEDINVDFNKGLTILTGETGAGKSILLGALGLVLGNRADLKVMKNASEKCIIEAEFAVSEYDLDALFASEDLDYETHTILRREILPSGKSRAFINDTPVTLQQMQLLGERLIDVHSQNDTQALITESYQMEVLDALASNGDQLLSYSGKFNEYQKSLKELEEIQSQRDQANRDHDYHSFLLQELTESNVLDIDQDSLEETYETLNNSEEIRESLSKTIQLLNEESMGGLHAITEARNSVNAIQDYAKNYETLWQRLNSVVIELEDIVSDLDDAAERVESNPQLLIEVNQQLQELYRLQKKHTVATVEELRVLESQLAEKVQSTGDLESKIENLQFVIEGLEHDLTKLSEELNNNRQQAIPVLKNRLEGILADLGMPNAQFDIRLISMETFKQNGTTTVQMFFTANKGSEPGLLSKVASGGEKSRIMLAVKSVLNDYKKLPTLIFDEIDTGISGEIALKMADIMSSMSRKMQVLSITHLAQIAAKGDHHKKVYKTDESGVTTTRIKPLTGDERVLEIAQMIGGANVSDSAIAHAKQLLN